MGKFIRDIIVSCLVVFAPVLIFLYLEGWERVFAFVAVALTVWLVGFWRAARR